MNRDFVEMLSELSAAGVEYLVVGAHALAAHGVPRATGDIDIWVRSTPENADRVLAALMRFGAPLFDLTREDLTRAGTVFQIGQPRLASTYSRLFRASPLKPPGPGASSSISRASRSPSSPERTSSRTSRLRGEQGTCPISPF